MADIVRVTNENVRVIERVLPLKTKIKIKDSSFIKDFRRARYLYDNEGEGEFVWRVTKYFKND